MSTGVNVDDVVTSLGAYSRKASKDIRSATLGEVQITKYFRTVTDVDDEYFLQHSITDRVVMGFNSEWQEKGETKFKPNLVKAFHFKVNFGFKPSVVWKSYLSYLANEKLDIVQYPLSKYIMEVEMAKTINRDRDYVMGRGQYNAATYDTVFGTANDGINEKLRQGIADGTMFKVNLPVFTSSNRVSGVEAFARAIPIELRDMMDAIFMSTSDLDAYKQDYRSTYGQNMDYSKDGLVKEYFTGIPLVGLNNLQSGRLWTTYPENRVRVVNKTDQPILTDIQKVDYKVKLFYEWFEGIGFHINQHVIVSVPNTGGYASGIASDADIYYVGGNPS